MNNENITFKEQYKSSKLTWQEKSILISVYHTAMCIRFHGNKDVYRWTLKDTASHFEVSIGLVSENIRIAKAIDNNDKISKKILDSKTREEGLKHIERRRYSQDRKEFIMFKIKE